MPQQEDLARKKEKDERKVMLEKYNSFFTPGHDISWQSEPPTLILKNFHFCQITRLLFIIIINNYILLFIM